MGLYGDNGKENGNYRDYGEYIGGDIGVILGLYGDNGKENGNYRDYRDCIGGYIGFVLGLYGDNGKEDGNYYIIKGFTGFGLEVLRL